VTERGLFHCPDWCDIAREPPRRQRPASSPIPGDCHDGRECFLSFPMVRCRLYLVKLGFRSTIRPMPACLAAEHLKVVRSNNAGVAGVFQ
jgi:hypothetical protein